MNSNTVPQTLLSILLCCLIGYALGNFSPSYILGRRKGYDIRDEGSGNAGAPTPSCCSANTRSSSRPFWTF